MPKHEGTPLQLGDTEYVLPILNIKAIKVFFPVIVKLRRDVASGSEEEQLGSIPALIDAQMDLVLAALKRNYPDLTRDVLEENLSHGMLAATFEELLKRSGFTLLLPGQAPGEAGSPQS